MLACLTLLARPDLLLEFRVFLSNASKSMRKAPGLPPYMVSVKSGTPAWDKVSRPAVRSGAWLFAVALALGWPGIGKAQSTTRQLLSSGTGVPGHAGFVFGAFSKLTMNEAKEIAFLSILRSARIELAAVVRSTGVTFSVIAFQGLRSPVQRASYESFSAPSMNKAGVVVFTARLKDDVPRTAVFRVEGTTTRAVAVSGTSAPGSADAPFQEFSAPLVSSSGDILFGARTGGKNPGTGLFQWTPRGIRSRPLPATLKLAPGDLLEPIYISRDEAVFVPRGASQELAVEQFFRAVAVKSFQGLKPAPRPSEVVEFIPSRPGERPVEMLVVLVEVEGDNVQTLELAGDPSQPVMAKHPPGVTLNALGRVLGQTFEARGNIIFAATTAGQENDLALYCFCDGVGMRLTSPEEFQSLMEAVGGRTLVSLAGDSQYTVGFILSGGQGGSSSGIYVTSVR